MSAHRARKSSRASNLPAMARLRRLRRTELPTDTVRLARYLIGKTLVHSTRGGVLVSGRIVETEAHPPGDPSGHAFRGKRFAVSGARIRLRLLLLRILVHDERQQRACGHRRRCPHSRARAAGRDRSHGATAGRRAAPRPRSGAGARRCRDGHRPSLRWPRPLRTALPLAGRRPPAPRRPRRVTPDRHHPCRPSPSLILRAGEPLRQPIKSIAGY